MFCGVVYVLWKMEMNSFYCMALGSYMLASVNLHKNNNPMFLAWTLFAIVASVMGEVFK